MQNVILPVPSLADLPVDGDIEEKLVQGEPRARNPDVLHFASPFRLYPI